MANAQITQEGMDLTDMDRENVDLTESESVRSATKKRTPRASQKELDSLREDVKSRFECIDSKLDRFFNMMDTAGSARQRPNDSDTGRNTAVSDRQSTRIDTDTGSRPLDSGVDTTVRIPLSLLSQRDNNTGEDDLVSLMPGRKERRDLLGDEDSMSVFGRSQRSQSVVNSDSDSDSDCRFQKYSQKTSDLLGEIFGEDAKTRTDKSGVGIVLDNSQIAVLKESWRTENPAKLSAYKDSYRSSFPVSQSAEEMLNVPSIDSIVNNLLLKKYGPKAAVKAQALCSQPLKDLEKIAFQGQHASRMGIVINAYMQQALGKLLAMLNDKQPNIDHAIQCVRDIFAMNTKSLDQVARAGALHHMVRRKSAMADSGLNDSKELRSHIWDLPLTDKGIFGPALEQKLKERQEINKQISDLLPEYGRAKRKTNTTGDQPWKKTRFNDFDRSHGGYRQSQSYGSMGTKSNYKPQGQSWTGQKFPRATATKTATVSKSTFHSKSK